MNAGIPAGRARAFKWWIRRHPQIVAEADKFVEYGTAWEFNEPLVSDNAGEPTVLIASTVTNRISVNSFQVTRTWNAIDECGNIGTCEQTMTINIPAAPRLEIQAIAPDSVQLRWLASAKGFQLQASDAMRNWTTVAEAPVVIGDYNVVVLRRDAQYLNFRLFIPGP